MIDSASSNCTAAIFCGGESLRMGGLARNQTKTLLAAHDTPLVWRMIDQLRSAGFSRIVVSTTPRFEDEIIESVDAYVRSNQAEQRVRVVVCESQRRGVLFGLRNVLDLQDEDRCLLCLGDIFFLSNPFLSIRPHVTSEYDCLGVAPVGLAEEIGQGGLVYQDKGTIHHVVERPRQSRNGIPMRWSGIALVGRRRTLAELDAFLLDAPEDLPAGDFFDSQCTRGKDLRCIAGPDFVNVNSPDHLLLASLYAKLESVSDRGFMSTALAEAAKSLRFDLASRFQTVPQGKAH